MRRASVVDERTTLAYDAAGRKTLERLPAGVRSTWARDAGDRLTRLAYVRSAGTTVASYGDRYDNAGNKIGSDDLSSRCDSTRAAAC